MRSFARKSKTSRTLLITAAIACVVALLLYVFLVINKSPVKHTQPKTNSSYSKGEPVADSPSSNNTAGSTDNESTAQPGDQKSSTSGSVAATLLAPSGDFVSSHHVSSSTTLVSVCNTTPGATCQIKFSDGSQTISLPAQTADRGGSAYWDNWTPAQYGITAGSWKITAYATLNGQTKSSQDSLELAVTQ
jgi:cytoskeletal protein RodZ